MDAKKDLTETQEIFIQENYLKMSMNDMCMQCGATYHFIRKYMRINKLIVPKVVVRRFQSEKIKALGDPAPAWERNPYRIQ